MTWSWNRYSILYLEAWVCLLDAKIVTLLICIDTLFIIGLKAAIGLFGGNQNEYMSQGGSFALSMIEASIGKHMIFVPLALVISFTPKLLCIGIALGLCIANLLVYPKGAQHTPLMNF